MIFQYKQNICNCKNFHRLETSTNKLLSYKLEFNIARTAPNYLYFMTENKTDVTGNTTTKLKKYGVYNETTMIIVVANQKPCQIICHMTCVKYYDL